MKLCYMLFKSYGFALFLFTLITKLLMLPSSIKQQKSTAKMAKLQPKLEQIKKRYANNRDKLNEATMELYNQEGVSPTGGCGSMIITYILLFAVIEVVYAPMSYISGLPSDKVNAAVQTVVELNTVSTAVKNDHGTDREVGFTIAERLEQGEDLRELLAKYNVPAKEGAEPPFTEERLEEQGCLPAGPRELSLSSSRLQRITPSSLIPKSPISATASTIPSAGSISANIRAGLRFIS